MTEYLVIYETAEDGGLGSLLPRSARVRRRRRDEGRVEQLISEAIPMHISLMRELGEPIPEPRHLAGSVSA